jgi:hypothetical protein
MFGIIVSETFHRAFSLDALTAGYGLAAPISRYVISKRLKEQSRKRDATTSPPLTSAHMSPKIVSVEEYLGVLPLPIILNPNTPAKPGFKIVTSRPSKHDHCFTIIHNQTVKTVSPRQPPPLPHPIAKCQ